MSTKTEKKIWRYLREIAKKFQGVTIFLGGRELKMGRTEEGWTFSADCAQPKIPLETKEVENVEPVQSR